jgi:AraC-like DNA-binding protein/mannose-6-phosphate isomerase-like protein (cupin superfamily)
MVTGKPSWLVETIDMDWIERLNRAPARVALGGATAEVLHWAYHLHLLDNQPHRHTYFEVCLMGAHGAGEYRVEQEAHRIAPGDLFIARPGVIHQIVNTGPRRMELYWVAFQWTPGAAPASRTVETLLHEFTDAARVLVIPDAGGRLGQMWRLLRSVADDAPLNPTRDAQIAALMAALLLGIVQAGAGGEARLPEGDHGDASSSLARVAVRYIHDNLNRPLAVGEVADYLHLSPRHLTRLVTRFTGVAPAAYIEQARMDRARTLLLRTDDAIKQIAALVGYRDVHHFTRVFSRRFGCPPGMYRQGLGDADVPNRQKPGALV